MLSLVTLQIWSNRGRLEKRFRRVEVLLDYEDLRDLVNQSLGEHRSVQDLA